MLHLRAHGNGKSLSRFHTRGDNRAADPVFSQARREASRAGCGITPSRRLSLASAGGTCQSANQVKAPTFGSTRDAVAAGFLRWKSLSSGEFMGSWWGHLGLRLRARRAVVVSVAAAVVASAGWGHLGLRLRARRAVVVSVAAAVVASAGVAVWLSGGRDRAHIARRELRGYPPIALVWAERRRASYKR